MLYVCSYLSALSYLPASKVSYVFLFLSTYLVLGQDIYHVLLLNVSNLLLATWVRECLSDWVILHFLLLHELVRHFPVRFSLALEVLFLLCILVDFASPSIVAIVQAHGLVGLRQSVTHLDSPD